MAIVVRPKEVGGAFPIPQLLDVVVLFELPLTGKFQSTLWSLSSASVLPVKESAKTIMRITGRIVAGDALMVLLVKLVLGRLVAPTLWVVLVRNGLTLTLRPLVLANIHIYIYIYISMYMYTVSTSKLCLS